MDKADFIHLVRLSEHASAENSGAYRRSLARFAALGYLWVVVCIVLAIVLLVMSSKALLQGPVKGYWVMLLLSGVGLLWSSVRALWLRLEAPEGSPLTPADAPLLFEALERIRKKTQGPPIHHVLLDSSFNASISQLPRFGLLGGATNYLTIGLPLLLALDRPRFLAVMAHEYGHLRGGHGQFAAWIYRTRMSWTKLYESMEEDAGLMAHATQTFTKDEAYFLNNGPSLNSKHHIHEKYIKMQGRKIYEFALTKVPAAMKIALDKSGVAIEDVKKIFIHQANEKMDEAIIDRFYRLYKSERPENVMPMNIQFNGNSSVATVPTLLDAVIRGEYPEHQLNTGDVIILASVGAGMNINAVVYRW